MKSYYVKPKVYMDKGALSVLLRGVKRAFIVTDNFMYESGMVKYLTEPMDGMGVGYEFFTEVKPDPDIATVTKLIGKFADSNASVLFALGGGSVIDAAKAANYICARQGIIKDEAVFVAVPTTSGTGSEMTSFAVISDPQKSAKYALVEDAMLPDAAILDAELTKSLPAKTTADTGIDVLTHAIEAFVSTRANDFTDASAEKAVKLVRSNLLRVYKNPADMEARQKMQHASCLAGMAFNNAGLGVNHSLAHTLGGHFHIPHGRVNGILLPYVMSYNAGCREGALTPVANRYARLARICMLDGASMRQSAFNAIRATRQLVRSLGIPVSIEAYGVKREDYVAAIDEMAEEAMADTCTATNPRVPAAEDLKKVLMEAYEGRRI